MSKTLRSLLARSLAAVGGASILWGWSAGAAQATADIVNANGFENPPFVVGALEGQNGWRNSVIGSNASTATIQTAVKLAGNQALQVDRAANSDERWGLPVSGYPTGRYVRIEWDMRVAKATDLPLFGPFFGVEAYDDNGVFGLLGSLGVDASTGDVLYQTQDTGVLTETGATVGVNQWNNFRIQLDFFSNAYTVFLNGSPLASTGFVDRGASGTDLDELSDASIAAIAASIDAQSQALAGRAYFDNFSVYDVDAGDFNADLTVNGADFALWQSSFGVSNAADANGNGRTEGLDLMRWMQQFGSTGGSAEPAAGISLAAVPEPHALALCGLAGAAALAQRRRPSAV